MPAFISCSPIFWRSRTSCSEQFYSRHQSARWAYDAFRENIIPYFGRSGKSLSIRTWRQIMVAVNDRCLPSEMELDIRPADEYGDNSGDDGGDDDGDDDGNALRGIGITESVARAGSSSGWPYL